MSTQIFLHFELQGRAIHGEATTIGYEGEIELESFNFDIGEPSEASDRKEDEAHKQAVYEAKKEGKPEPKRKRSGGKERSVTLTKFYDKLSTNFARYLASGVLFDEARISIDHHVSAGRKKANPAMTIYLFDGRITSVELTLADSDKSAKLTETIKLSYRKIEISYFKPGADDRSTRVFDSTFSQVLREKAG